MTHIIRFSLKTEFTKHKNNNLQFSIMLVECIIFNKEKLKCLDILKQIHDIHYIKTFRKNLDTLVIW